MNSINVAILGLGTVGGGTFQILQMNKELIAKRTGKDINVTRILDLNEDALKRYGADVSIMTKNIDDITLDPNIDVVIETMGGIEPATSFMMKALQNGKNVITANKAAVANSYPELVKTAKENNVFFKFEASVGGAIPVLTSILDPLSGNNFTKVMGIVNGTTNYILTKMADEGLNYDDVLKEAQAKGFAEADPTADVEGIDVANKLSILIALLFDEYIHPNDIPTEGISKITDSDIKKAAEENCKIKLIAYASKENEKLEYFVKPMSIPCSTPLAGVSNEYNAILINGNAFDEVMLYGKGAGSVPTGSAIVGDIIAIAKNIK